MSITVNLEPVRNCSGCTLCCKLLPMHAGTPTMPGSIHKAAGVRCPQQQTGKGCAIYNTRPACCRMWACRWLTGEDTRELPRPDRAHYVIDAMPDYVEARPNDGSPPTSIQVVQVWVDQKYPDAWRAPEMLAYLERQAKRGIAAIIRFNEHDALTVFAPTFMNDGEWHELPSNEMQRRKQHSFAEIVKALEGAQRDLIEREK